MLDSKDAIGNLLKDNKITKTTLKQQIMDLRNGDKVTSILTEDKLLDLLTVESTKATAKKYLSGEDFIRIVLLPEDK